MGNISTLFAQTGHFLNRFKHVDDKVESIDAIQKQFSHSKK